MVFLKSIADSLTGGLSNFFQTLLSLAKIAVLFRRPVNYPRVQGTTCIILGNGPSLLADIQDQKQVLRKHSLMCVNGFSLSDEFADLQPRHYLMLDPAFWEGQTEQIRGILHAIAIKTTWQLDLFIPHAAKHSENLKMLASNSNVQIRYFNYIVYKGFKIPGYWFFRSGWAMPQCQNVLVAAIFHGINLGYRNVILLGADHSWHENIVVKEDNVVYTREVHFYDNVEHCRQIPFVKGTDAKDTWTMSDLFLLWSKVFNGYFTLNAYANRHNCSIFNAGSKTYIDAYPRTSLSDTRWK